VQKQRTVNPHPADIDAMAAGSPGGVVSAGDAQAFAQVRNTSE
jgi:hypothetical protein